MAPKKSIFRAPGAQHFQLVHRSQQDPLINDPEASQRVLKPVGRANDKKTNYTLADLKATLDHSQLRENEGEAALYGITYDDSQYDYMSHLKPIGMGGGAVDSVMIPAPRGSGVASGMKRDLKGKGKARAEDLFVPRDVLASETERPVEEVWASQEAVPRELQGLQPDMDPHLRQVLEALEDDAFIDAEEDDGEGGEWFGELMGGGERRDYDAADWKFEEWGMDEDDQPRRPPPADGHEDGEREETWEDRFKAFKQSQKAGPSSAQGDSEFDDAERSEMADTVGTLGVGMADLMVSGGKKRRGKRGPSDATGMSMSSSSVFRTSGLTDLDARFDKIAGDYDLEDDEEEYYSDDDNVSIAASQMSSLSTFSKSSLFSHASAAPPDISREDFDAILDDFLDNYEILGRRMRPALGNVGLTGPEKLAVLRGAIESEADGIGKEENRRRILEIEKMGRGVRSKLGKEDRMVRVRREEDEGEKWDAETILTTYTNTENHPAMIRSRRPDEARRRAERQSPPSPATSMPSVPVPRAAVDSDDDEDTSGSETEREGPKITVSRPKGESPEERKARKASVKADRSARRAEKKSHKETFSVERRKQLKTQAKMVGGGKAADLNVGNRGIVSLS